MGVLQVHMGHGRLPAVEDVSAGHNLEQTPGRRPKAKTARTKTAATLGSSGNVPFGGRGQNRSRVVRRRLQPTPAVRSAHASGIHAISMPSGEVLERLDADEHASADLSFLNDVPSPDAAHAPPFGAYVCPNISRSCTTALECNSF